MGRVPDGGSAGGGAAQRELPPLLLEQLCGSLVGLLDANLVR